MQGMSAKTSSYGSAGPVMAPPSSGDGDELELDLVHADDLEGWEAE